MAAVFASIDAAATSVGIWDESAADIQWEAVSFSGESIPKLKGLKASNSRKMKSSKFFKTFACVRMKLLGN